MLQLQMRDIQQLLTDADGDVLSLYLRVDPADRENQAQSPAWKIRLKNARREITADLTDDAARERWAVIERRLDDFLTDYTPSGKTLVLFMGADLLQTYTLPVRLEPDYAYGKPLVAPLLWALDEYEPYLIVLVDQDRARFLNAFLGTADEQGEMAIDLDYDWAEKTLMPATSAIAPSGGPGLGIKHGSHRDRFDQMIDAHIKRFYKDVAERVAELAKERDTSRIIIGGNEQSAHAVRDALNSHNRLHIVALVPMDMTSSVDSVLERVRPHAETYEQQQEMALVDQLVNVAKASGRAVLGKERVLDALKRQQVELVVAPWPMRDAALAQDLPTLVLNVGNELQLVHGEAAERLKREGGLAARLYYTV